MSELNKLTTLSIVVPCYNVENYLYASLNSLREACLDSIGVVDLVLVDDASQDNTLELLRRHPIQHDPRFSIQLISLDKNVGPGVSRRIAIEHSRGDFIAFHDADDIALEMRFIYQLQSFISDSKLGMIGGSLLMARENAPFVQVFPCNHEALLVESIFCCPIWGCATMLRRSSLIDVPPPELRIGEDWLHAFRLAKHWRIGSIAQPVVKHLIHSGQTMQSEGATNHAVFNVWREVLSALGIHDPTMDQLALHAAVSPYWSYPLGSPMSNLHERVNMKNWQAWRSTIFSANDKTRIVSPVLLQERLDRIDLVLQVVQQPFVRHLPVRRNF
ncbi:glycosyltransferase family 2 protein [Crenobacter intestini]|uniref:glycosyltransferase family 2 protein n=1 Tax=Crenobacter intestini TaxID=2563443 RepID=UPI00145868D1|nr:glycosyltransferase family 2 protein [Crenobacter intestini]